MATIQHPNILKSLGILSEKAKTKRYVLKIKFQAIF